MYLRHASPLPALALLVLAPASLAQVEVAQESAPGVGDFDAHVLGTIQPVATSSTISQYYGFDAVSGSFNGPEPAPDADAAFLFLVDSSSTGLSLVLLYGEVNAAFSGSVEIDSRVTVSGDPDGAQFQVYDGLPSQGTHVDRYTDVAGSYFGVNHGYGACCTDGMALGALDGDWVVTYELVSNVNGGGVTPTRLEAYSSGGSIVSLALEPGRRVRLRPQGSPSVVLPYCFADATSPDCPCGNGDDTYTGGCANSLGDGASLVATGSTSVAANDLTFSGRRLPAGRSVVVFHGSTGLALPFADGLRCAGGRVVRYPLQTTDAAGQFAQAGTAGLGGAAAGQTLHFQAWYRDPAGPCGGGAGFSNAVQVSFTP